MRRERRDGCEGIEGQKKGGKERGTRGGKQVDRKGGEKMGANRRTGKQRDRWRGGQ